MAESKSFQLERFYYGVLVDSKMRTSASPGVIARSENITATHVAEVLRKGSLAPPTADEVSDDMPGALGLFRGEKTDFILTKAQRNEVGLGQTLHLLMPAEVMRQMGGNVITLHALGVMDMPAFSANKTNLQPFTLSDVQPPTIDAQTETLLDLILYCQDSFANIEGLLAALVQGWPLAIVNSPRHFEKRLRFVQGLLGLLPVPARVGISFATHVREAERTPVQIKFLNDAASPAQHCVYDWANAKMVTKPPEDSYSHYMVAQLRLDPSLVIEQTAALSQTAVWRARHRENLGRALAWVSRRAAIDSAVRDGQPADREIVGAILRDDPTLSEPLRQSYTRHLLAFALALDDTESADVVPTVCVGDPGVTQMVMEQIHSAIENGQARVAFSMLERWLLRVPEAAALRWHTLLHMASRQHLADLLKDDNHQPALEFLDYVQKAPAALRLREATPALLKVALGSVQVNPHLARILFLMAVEGLPAGELYRLLGVDAFRTQLPPELQEAISYLQRQPRVPAPPQVLDRGARVYGEGSRMLVLARLVEWAVYLERTELIDTAALQALLVMAQSQQAEQFVPLIEQVVGDFSQVSIIQVLAPPGPRVLVQLYLQIGHDESAVDLLEFYQNNVYGLSNLKDFGQVARDVFRFTPLSAERLTQALETLTNSQIRPEPRAMMYAGALQNREFAADADFAARRLTSMIFNDNNLISVVGQDMVLQLLNYHAGAKNAIDVMRVAAALIDHALEQRSEGALLIVRMWPAITWDGLVKEGAQELLRRYVRGVPPNEVDTIIAYFTDELGADVGEMLHATMLTRRIMGGGTLMTLTQEIQMAEALLTDISVTYHTEREIPPMHRLKRDLDSMTGGLTREERDKVAENLLAIMRTMLELGRDRERKRARKSNDDTLVKGISMPQSGLELLSFVGGHFNEHRIAPLDLNRESMAHIFGDRSAAMFLRETNAVRRLLEGLSAAFPARDYHDISVKHLQGELDSLWSTLSLYNQRQIRQGFAEGSQRLAQVILLIAGDGNDRVLASGGIGRQLETGQRQPRTALEALRWIYGYFARKHTR